MEMRPGGRTEKNPSPEGRGFSTLDEMGLSYRSIARASAHATTRGSYSSIDESRAAAAAVRGHSR